MDPKETEIFAVAIIALILLGIIFAYFIISLVFQQRRHIKLQKERIFAEIITLENERRRVVTELHDGIGPLLSSIKLNINSLDTEIEEDINIIKNASSRMDEVMQNIRDISYDLMPVILERNGLNEAIKHFVTRNVSQKKMQVELVYDQQLIIADKQKELNIYRIIQEIVHNTVKHAQATKLVIELRREKGLILLITQDNGIGFDHVKMRNNNKAGLGLKSIENRSEILKGKLILSSKKNVGTRYIIEMPF